MSGSKEVIKIKIISLIAEKRVEQELSVRKLTIEEQEKLYIDTFNYYQEILKNVD